VARWLTKNRSGSSGGGFINLQIILDIDSGATNIRCIARRRKLRIKSIHTLAMAKRRTKPKRKVPTVKLEDVQKTTNDNLGATMQSFEGATRVTQEIANQIADYSKRSFEHGTKTMENLLSAKSLDKAIEVQTEYAKTAYEGYVSHATKLGQLYTDLAKETFKSYQDLASKVTPVK
jgi:hypothetical protein